MKLFGKMGWRLKIKKPNGARSVPGGVASTAEAQRKLAELSINGYVCTLTQKELRELGSYLHKLAADMTPGPIQTITQDEWRRRYPL